MNHPAGNLRYYEKKRFKNMGSAIVYAVRDFISKRGYAPDWVQVRESEITDKDIAMLSPYPLDIELVERGVSPSHFILFPIIYRRSRVLLVRRTPLC